jgi:1-acyl-sn-glycerol-3-phosphate acyltransferase
MLSRVILAPVYFVYKLWVGFVFWITLFLLYPIFAYLLHKKCRYPAAFRWKLRWSVILQWLLFCPMKVIRKSLLPQTPFVIVSNHSSYLDTVFMYRVIPNYFVFIGKGELLKWPLFSLFFRTMDIPVNRNNQKMAYDSLKLAYEALDRGECVAMYPEGTIPLSSPKMKSFKNGAFRMAMDKGVPIVPITWQSNYLVMNNPEKLFSYSLPHAIKVVVHPPVFPKGKDEGDLVALRQEVFEIINSELPEEFRREV